MKIPANAPKIVKEAALAVELTHTETPKVDAQFLAIAEDAAQRSGSFFSVVGGVALEGETRPDSINHKMTLLPPNVYSTAELDEVLGYVDALLGAENTQMLTAKFSDYAQEHALFERIQNNAESAGEKFLIISNHLQLADQGFTMGLLHKAARMNNVDRIENHLTVVVGRIIGYFQLGDKNVIDGILRKAGSVLKTFPAIGTSEAGELDDGKLRLVRSICNHWTKQSLGELLDSNEGRIICMAPSGEQDKEQDGSVLMSHFSGATADLIVEANNRGATIIPVFVDYANDQSIVAFLDPIPPASITSREDCDSIGSEIAATGSLARGEMHHKHPDIARFGNKVIYQTS
jgi:hypothetical protein